MKLIEMVVSTFRTAFDIPVKPASCRRCGVQWKAAEMVKDAGGYLCRECAAGSKITWSDKKDKKAYLEE